MSSPENKHIFGTGSAWKEINYFDVWSPQSSGLDPRVFADWLGYITPLPLSYNLQRVGMRI